MAKYPNVAKLFSDRFADEFGVVSTETRKLLMERTGRRDATISRWISGESRPESDTWRAIADVAGVSVDVVADAARGDQTGEPTSGKRWTQISGDPGGSATVSDVRSLENELEGESELRLALENNLNRLRAVVELQGQVIVLLGREARERLGADSEIAERLAALEAVLGQRRVP